MKRLACLLLAVLALVGLAACAGGPLQPARRCAKRNSAWPTDADGRRRRAEATNCRRPTPAGSAVSLPYRWAREPPRRDRPVAAPGSASISWRPNRCPRTRMVCICRACSMGGSFHVNGTALAASAEPTTSRADALAPAAPGPASRRRLCARPNTMLHVRIDSPRRARRSFRRSISVRKQELRACFDRRYLAEYSSAQFSARRGAVVAVFMLAHLVGSAASELLYLPVRPHLPVLGAATQTYLTETMSVGLVVALARPVLRLDRRLRAVGRGFLPALRGQARASAGSSCSSATRWSDRCCWSSSQRRAAVFSSSATGSAACSCWKPTCFGDVLPVAAAATEPGGDRARRRSIDDVPARRQ